MHTIEVKNLRKDFKISKNKQISALNGISFDVKQGEIFGFIGPNGAGKTTTIKILLGFIPSTSGEVSIMGHDAESARYNVRIGYTPEDHAYYPHLKVKDFLKYLAALSIESGSISESVDKVIESFNLEEVHDRRLDDLSLGWNKKVALAAAFVDDPEIIILDEPISGLDPIAVDELTALLRESKSMNKTILFSSHQLSEVEQIADSICIIDKGDIVKKGPIDELLSNSDAGSLKELFLNSVGDRS